MASAGKSYLEKAMSFMFFVEEKSEHYAFACLLDPRTMDYWTSLMEELPGLAGKGVIEEYGEKLVQKIQQMITDQGKETTDNSQERKPTKFSQYANTAANRMMAEKEFYDFINWKWDLENLTTENLLTWFNENKVKFPRLHAMAKALFCMPGSTMENERVFSITGKILYRYENII
jgi:hypothetical protein